MPHKHSYYSPNAVAEVLRQAQQHGIPYDKLFARGREIYAADRDNEQTRPLHGRLQQALDSLINEDQAQA
jgi:hypothetical protein